jgi:hypothetical protein
MMLSECLLEAPTTNALFDCRHILNVRGLICRCFFAVVRSCPFAPARVVCCHVQLEFGYPSWEAVTKALTQLHKSHHRHLHLYRNLLYSYYERGRPSIHRRVQRCRGALPAGRDRAMHYATCSLTIVSLDTIISNALPCLAES